MWGVPWWRGGFCYDGSMTRWVSSVAVVGVLLCSQACSSESSPPGGGGSGGDAGTGGAGTGGTGGNGGSAGSGGSGGEAPFSGGELIDVPAGTFDMGGPGDESQALPVHEVTLTRAFVMGRAEVTNRDFAAMLNLALGDGALAGYEGGTTVENASGLSVELIDLDGVGTTAGNDCKIAYDGGAFVVDDGFEESPVNWVTWFGAAFFCNRLGELEGYAPLYDLSDWSVDHYGTAGYRLPTEAEWERAARYDDGRSYPWGSTPEPSDTLANYDFLVNNVSPVCSYPSGHSQLGFCDLAGNVLEWTSTRFHTYPTDPQTDPVGPTSVVERVIRGGSWNHVAERLLTWDRYYIPPPSEAFGGMGFRVVRITP